MHLCRNLSILLLPCLYFIPVVACSTVAWPCNRILLLAMSLDRALASAFNVCDIKFDISDLHTLCFLARCYMSLNTEFRCDPSSLIHHCLGCLHTHTHYLSSRQLLSWGWSHAYFCKWHQSEFRGQV